MPARSRDRFIRIEGARQNNLKGVTVRVPVGAVTAVTGVAGAGKSSLAFDVLSEGYRRYVETFSPYARQFLERLDRRTIDIDPDLVVPDPGKSIAEGCIRPFQGDFYSECQRDLLRFLRRRGLPANVPWSELRPEARRLVWEGEPGGRERWRSLWYGIDGFFEWLESRTYRMQMRVFLSRYRRYLPCPDCKGTRLKPGAVLFRIGGRTLPDVEAAPIAEAERLFRGWSAPRGDVAAALLLREVRARLAFLCDVGLGYLTLARTAPYLRAFLQRAAHRAAAASAG